MRLAYTLRPWLDAGMSLEQGVRELGNLGYEGVEIGMRFVRSLELTGEDLNEACKSSGVELAGLFSAIAWHEVGESNPLKAIEQEVALAEATGARLLTACSASVTTGPPEQASRANEAMRVARHQLQRCGVELLYYNHDREFLSDGVFDTLTDGLDLALDLGHLARAVGADGAEAIIERERGRVRHLHVRDVLDGHWMPALGQGTLPYGSWLARLIGVDWVTGEMLPDNQHPELTASWTGPPATYAGETLACLSRLRSGGPKEKAT